MHKFLFMDAQINIEGGTFANLFCIKMFVKKPCTALFVGPMGCGKTKMVFHLLAGEFKGHFEYVMALCSTLRWNKTYFDGGLSRQSL